MALSPYLRRRAGRTSMTIDVDIDEVFAGMCDEELAQACSDRRILVLSATDLSEVRAALAARDLEGAMLRLERLLPSDLRVFAKVIAERGRTLPC